MSSRQSSERSSRKGKRKGRGKAKDPTPDNDHTLRHYESFETIGPPEDPVDVDDHGIPAGRDGPADDDDEPREDTPLLQRLKNHLTPPPPNPKDPADPENPIPNNDDSVCSCECGAWTGFFGVAWVLAFGLVLVCALTWAVVEYVHDRRGPGGGVV